MSKTMKASQLSGLIHFAERELEDLKRLGYSQVIGMNSAYAYRKGYLQGLQDYQNVIGEEEER